MQVENMTIEDLVVAIQQETDTETLQQLAIAMATDLKTTKEVFFKMLNMFGLIENGSFKKDVKLKAIISEVLGAATEAMNPFADKKAMEERYSFMKEMVPLAEKYQCL